MTNDELASVIPVAPALGDLSIGVGVEMDREVHDKLIERLQALQGPLEKMPIEQAAALQFRVYATHLLEAADWLDTDNIGYGLVVAESMSCELHYKALALEPYVMSLPLEGRSLIEVLRDTESAADHRFVELLEKACVDIPREGK